MTTATTIQNHHIQTDSPESFNTFIDLYQKGNVTGIQIKLPKKPTLEKTKNVFELLSNFFRIQDEGLIWIHGLDEYTLQISSPSMGIIYLDAKTAQEIRNDYGDEMLQKTSKPSREKLVFNPMDDVVCICANIEIKATY